MRILLVSAYPLPAIGKTLIKRLRKSGAQVTSTRRLADLASAEKYDLVVVLGLDRDILKAFHHMDAETPVLGVNTSGTQGFLASVTAEEVERRLGDLLSGSYSVERYPRLSVTVDGRQGPPALNELAVFPSRSAVLMEYKLEVDGEEIWRDYADGVIVATPLGSTAYAFSAGGPVIHQRSGVYEVVPVNSMDPARRPIIVPLSSKVRVTEINSRYPCEVIVDGVYRARVDERVEAMLNGFAHIVRLRDRGEVSDRIYRKVDLSKEIRRMPPSAKFVLRVLEEEGPLTLKGLVARTMLPTRTVQRALAVLIRNGLVKRMPNIRDMRQDIYVLKEMGGR